MLNSFNKKGFNHTNTEFLYIDNTKYNAFDAYSGINHILNIATGQYIINLEFANGEKKSINVVVTK
jgi:hypothetical protein